MPIPAVIAASRTIAARMTRGAISLSTSNHFAPIAYSKLMKPVALPPGRDMLLTNPAPTGYQCEGSYQLPSQISAIPEETPRSGPVRLHHPHPETLALPRAAPALAA